MLATGLGDLRALALGDVTGDGIDDVVALQGDSGSRSMTVLVQCSSRDLACQRRGWRHEVSGHHRRCSPEPRAPTIARPPRSTSAPVRKAYSAQSFSTAAEEFEQAFAASPMPEIAFSAAQAYRRAYRSEPRPQYVRRSVELYKIYLAQVKTGGRIGDAADNLGEMERELDRLKQSGAALAASPSSARSSASA